MVTVVNCPTLCSVEPRNALTTLPGDVYGIQRYGSFLVGVTKYRGNSLRKERVVSIHSCGRYSQPTMVGEVCQPELQSLWQRASLQPSSFTDMKIRKRAL